MIERAIIANMALAIQKNNIDQLDRARELLNIVKSEEFFDYDNEDKSQAERMGTRRDVAFNAVRELGLPSNLRSVGHAIANSFIQMEIETLNPRYIPDSHLLHIPRIGPKKLRLLREIFPYEPLDSTR